MRRAVLRKAFEPAQEQRARPVGLALSLYAGRASGRARLLRGPEEGSQHWAFQVR
jgi:hypothetical protein